MVTVFSNQAPGFINDFSDYPGHASIRVEPIAKLVNFQFQKEIDIAFIVPDLAGDTSWYVRLVRWIEKKNPKVIMLNFETTNWKSKYDRYANISYLENSQLETAKYSHMIVSSSQIGNKYAKDYYHKATGKSHIAFRVCSPPTNSRILGNVPEHPRERIITVITRFVPRHKNGHRLYELICQEMKGYDIHLIIGFGDFDDVTLKRYYQAFEIVGARLHIEKRISEDRKYQLLRRSRVTLFPSSFEGFGLPPIESLVCGAPCICFDLPVFREIHGDSLIYARHNDFSDFRKKIECFLRNYDKSPPKLPSINYDSSFEAFSNRLNDLINELTRF